MQHPLEVHHAKGSARLLHLSLPNSRLVVAEAMPDAELRQLLAGKNNLLLYPETPDDSVTRPPPPLEPAWLADPASLRLVVLDGTWRKSRKMLYLNPLLQQLPRLPLRNTPPSHYLIRKAPAPDQLSTLEACCYALTQLDPSATSLPALIDRFDGFIAQQQSYSLPPGASV